MYNPTTSLTFSIKKGSVEILKVSTLCGLSPKARHMRKIAFCVRPLLAAIERVDQCVASFGILSSVSLTTRSTSSSVIVRGGPGRGASYRPSNPCDIYLLRHFPTVYFVTSNSFATWESGIPWLHNKTIFPRKATPCPRLRLRSMFSSASCSSSFKTNSARGRPLPIITPFIEVSYL